MVSHNVWCRIRVQMDANLGEASTTKKHCLHPPDSFHLTLGTRNKDDPVRRQRFVLAFVQEPKFLAASPATT